MKTWTQSELNNVIGLLRPLVGLRLQEVATSDRDLVLGFYSPNGLLWLWADLNAVAPSLLPWTELPLRPAPQKSPLALFLKAHFVGRSLSDIEIPQERGRVVFLQFGAPDPDEDGPRLELRLFPHGRNAIASSSGRSVAWQKPAPLPEHSDEGPSHLLIRSLDQLREEWLASRGGSKAAAKTDPKARLENDLRKKQKALEKVRDELSRKKELPWRAIGHWLKERQTTNVPSEWEPFVDKRRKLAWNIEQCFNKAREVEEKSYGTEKRIAELEAEIARLKERLIQPAQKIPVDPPKPKLPVSGAGAHGRTLRISEELVLMAGKSATDNLKLLRQARAWDLWFHLRDYPSSHAILFRNKNAKVGDAVLQTVADWFIRNHFGAKAEQHAGEKFDLIVAECRHVRPIKGDKIGRVTYRDERILTFKFTTS